MFDFFDESIRPYLHDNSATEYDVFGHCTQVVLMRALKRIFVKARLLCSHSADNEAFLWLSVIVTLHNPALCKAVSPLLGI